MSSTLISSPALDVHTLRSRSQAGVAWLAGLRYLVRGFEIDLRSLAVFRIGLGLVVMASALIAMNGAQVFYSDFGVLPRSLLLQLGWGSEGLWSLNMLNGSPVFQLLLGGVLIAASCCLIAGYRTRLSTFVCWMLICSFEVRNPAIVNGSDAVTRLLLFWSFFLPLGAMWSVDSTKARTRPAGMGLLSLPSACLLLQVVFLYVFAALLKGKGDYWWKDANALQFALHLDSFATPVGIWLRDFAGFCQVVTRTTWLVELVVPLLALLPFLRTFWRLLAIGCFVALHAGIAICMDIGAFSWLMMAVWCVFLPTAFWNKIIPQVQKVVAKFGWLKKYSSSTQSASVVAVKTHWITTVCSGFFLLFVFMWNLRGMDFERWEKVFPRSINGLAFALRLDQHWAMFAPNPPLEDGWFVLSARLSDGTEIDLLREGDSLDWSKPALVSAVYEDARWQKYMMNLWLTEYVQYRPWLGDYLSREWNKEQGALSQVMSWELFYMQQKTALDRVPDPVEKISLWKCEEFAR